MFETLFWVACLGAFLAGLVRGFAGFGAGMIMGPTFAFVFGPVLAIPLIQLLDFIVQIQVVPANWRVVKWRALMPMALAASATMPLGIYFLTALDPLVIKRALSIIIFLLLALLVSGWRYRGPRGRVMDCIVGGVSGTLSGAVGLGGPPIIVYSMASGDNAAATRAVIIGFFAISGFALVAWFALRGLITTEVLWNSLYLTPIYIGGAFIGGRLFPYASERQFRMFAYIAIGAIAALGFWSTL